MGCEHNETRANDDLDQTVVYDDFSEASGASMAKISPCPFLKIHQHCINMGNLVLLLVTRSEINSDQYTETI